MTLGKFWQYSELPMAYGKTFTSTIAPLGGEGLGVRQLVEDLMPWCSIAAMVFCRWISGNDMANHRGKIWRKWRLGWRSPNLSIPFWCVVSKWAWFDSWPNISQNQVETYCKIKKYWRYLEISAKLTTLGICLVGFKPVFFLHPYTGWWTCLDDGFWRRDLEPEMFIQSTSMNMYPAAPQLLTRNSATDWISKKQILLGYIRIY